MLERNNIIFSPIGVVYSPFKDAMGMPIQSSGGRGIRGIVEIYPEYVEGLTDIAGFSHIILLYYFDRCWSPTLSVRPFLDDREHGIFSTRAPNRPNPVGISIVRLISVSRAGILEICDLDIMDGTPLIDIKPYIPAFDAIHADKTGWFGEVNSSAEHTRADRRFMQ